MKNISKQEIFNQANFDGVFLLHSYIKCFLHTFSDKKEKKKNTQTNKKKQQKKNVWVH